MTQRILLADDEEAITSELAPLLERSGFEVVVARDGTGALRLAGSSPAPCCSTARPAECSCTMR